MARAEMILNVNDSAATRYMISRILKQSGFEVEEADSGLAALDFVRSRSPRLVVLDIKLPDMDGLQLCRVIKRDPALRRIKVLHTSAVFLSSDYKVQSLDSGADGYLTHPFEREELIALIRSLLRLTDAEQRLRDQADELRQANQRTHEFLAMLAHELRNPLAAIVTSLPLLERRDAPERMVVQARDRIRRQTGHLTNLVGDLLDVARVTQGKIELRWESIDLVALLERVAAGVRDARLAPRGQSLELALPPTIAMVRGDLTRLEQVFANLLDNAGKYSDEGARIRLSMTVEPGDGGDDSGRAVVVVADDGIGIAPEMIPRIFELFTQVDVPLSRSRGGLGIGLTVVKTLIEMHGGTVAARSAGAGCGSEFRVVLPCTVATRGGAIEQGTSASTRPADDALRILLVEDNPDARDALQALLESWGHDVTVAADGHEGIARALREQPDVALVDIGLPLADGYEVARRVREAGSMTRAPLLVALSGYGDANSRALGRAAGFDLHLVKPVEPERLREVLSLADMEPGELPRATPTGPSMALGTPDCNRPV